MLNNRGGYTLLGVVLIILILSFTTVAFVTEMIISVNDHQEKIDNQLAQIAGKNYLNHFIYQRQGKLEPTDGWVDYRDVYWVKYRIQNYHEYLCFDIWFYERYDEIFRAILINENNSFTVIKWGRIDDLPLETEPQKEG